MSGTTIGSLITISISKAVSSFTHTLEYKFGNKSGTIATKTSSSSVSWTPPIDLALQIPSSQYGTGTLKCITYNGGTIIGEKTINFMLYVPNSIKPSINNFTSSIARTNPSGCGMYVKNNSAVTWTVYAVGSYGSTITKCVINGQNLSETKTGSATSYSMTSHTLTVAGKQTYTVTVTDSRGRTASTTGEITIIDYNPPTITSITSFRSNADGSMNGSGQYVTHQLNASFYTLGGNNNIKIKAYSKKRSDATYSELNSVVVKDDASDRTSYTYTYKNASFAVDTAYDFKIVISDSVGQYAMFYTNVGTKNVPLNISGDNSSIAIGSFAQKQVDNKGLFRCEWAASFASSPQVDSDRNLKRNINDIDIDIIDKLKPVQYVLKNDDSDTIHYGFIAQDVEQALLQSKEAEQKIGIVHYDEDMETKERTNYSLAYDEIIPLLVKKCQELQREIDILKGE